MTEHLQVINENAESEAGTSISASRMHASMRSVQVAENVEIELENPRNVWKGTLPIYNLSSNYILCFSPSHCCHLDNCWSIRSAFDASRS
jgi:hypothetical protein